MNATIACPICLETLIEVEAGLNRDLANVILTGFGSSELQIRLPGKSWVTYMNPDRDAKGLLCASCGALTLAPSMPDVREAVGLRP